jgi:hypothetical protein
MGGDPLPLRVCLRILRSNDGGRHPPMNISRGKGSVLQLIVTGDPPDLTGLEVRALGKGETHRVGVGCFGILQGQGAGVNTPATPKIPPCLPQSKRSGGAIVGAEVIPQQMLLCCRQAVLHRMVPFSGWCNSRGSQRRSSVGCF